MKKKNTIIPAPILPLSAKVELFAKFLRHITKNTSTPCCQKQTSSTARQARIKKIASQKIRKKLRSYRRRKSA